MRRHEAHRHRSSVLLFAAALVFAPGDSWVGDRTAPERERGHMAARILAPTVDQGLSGEGRRVVAQRPSLERDDRAARDVLLTIIALTGICLVLLRLRRSSPIDVEKSSSPGPRSVSGPRRGPPLLLPI